MLCEGKVDRKPYAEVVVIGKVNGKNYAKVRSMGNNMQRLKLVVKRD